MHFFLCHSAPKHHLQLQNVSEAAPCFKELNVFKVFKIWGKGKVVPVLNQLSTVP
jgi:hypothetical protein